jgi:cytochrome c oxidase subunit II
MRSILRSKRLAAALLLGLLATLALAGCTVNNANMLEPAGPQADAESQVFYVILILAIVIFSGVFAVLLYSIIRFRERPGSAVPRQTFGHNALEIAWTVVPTLGLAALLAYTIITLFGPLAPPANPDMTVKVIGHQWWWEFRYQDQNIVTANELHIPQGKTVKLLLESNNVIHSFWVPAIAGKTDVIPGQHNTMWLEANKTGTYRGECTEFCGQQHAHMNFIVVVDSQPDYDAWATNQLHGPSADSQAMDGAKIFAQRCATCHLINGSTERVSQIGPNLTHVGSRQQIGAGVLENTPDNLRSWIHDTQLIKPGNDMPAFTNLNDQDLSALVAYIDSLK